MLIEDTTRALGDLGWVSIESERAQAEEGGTLDALKDQLCQSKTDKGFFLNRWTTS